MWQLNGHDATLCEIAQRSLTRFGNSVRNTSTDDVLHYINVECLAFTLGDGLDQWVAGMLPMAASSSHIEFLDAIMDGVVLPACTDIDHRVAMQAA